MKMTCPRCGHDIERPASMEGELATCYLCDGRFSIGEKNPDVFVATSVEAESRTQCPACGSLDRKTNTALWPYFLWCGARLLLCSALATLLAPLTSRTPAIMTAGFLFIVLDLLCKPYWWWDYRCNACDHKWISK